jgi:hypothetical protein
MLTKVLQTMRNQIARRLPHLPSSPAVASLKMKRKKMYVNPALDIVAAYDCPQATQMPENTRLIM